MKKSNHPDELQRIPGVGPSIAEDLRSVGIRRIIDLRNKHPQHLYDKLCQQAGMPIDRCLLYVLRCAVYFADTKHPDPHLLKWWNWKD